MTKLYFLLANRELGELDICLLKESGGFIGLLLLIDCNSRYLWFHKLKSKKKEQVISGLDAILKQSGTFERIVSDGKTLMTLFRLINCNFKSVIGELAFTRSYFTAKSVYYHALHKNQHASFIEVLITIIIVNG